jgi:hypothetical protein
LRPAWLPVAIVLAAGFLLFLPAVRSPLVLDDYFQTAMIEGTYPSPRSPFDLYDFVGDSDRTLLLDRGLIPWWSHPRLKVRFFRPLSSALLYADRRVFGDRPLLSHLHSFAWWVVAVLAARALYRRALAPRPALLALVIFSLASCHALPLLWLAHREAMVSLVFGLFALGSLLRFRAHASALHLVSAALLFGLSLLGGEYGLCFGGYALAIALTARRPSRLGRVLVLLSFAVPAATYLVVRAKLGYGTEGSGLYHDPFREPSAFFERLPRCLLTLLADGWLALDGDTIGPTTPLWVLGFVGVVGAALLVVPWRRALQRLDEEAREHATWLFVGSVLCLTPVLAVAPSTRVLGASFVGIAAVVALVLDRAWFPGAAEPRAGASELSGLVALGLGFAHLVHGPGTSWVTSRIYRAEALRFASHAADLRKRIGDPKTADIVLVRALNGDVFVLPYALDDKGTPPPEWHILALTGHVLMLRRDDRTIELVVAKDHGLFPIGEGNLFRGEGQALAVGDVIRVPGMRTTVLEVGEAGPRRARFEFDDALLATSRVWVADRYDGIEDATPPERGFGRPFEP